MGAGREREGSRVWLVLTRLDGPRGSLAQSVASLSMCLSVSQTEHMGSQREAGEGMCVMLRHAGGGRSSVGIPSF